MSSALVPFVERARAYAEQDLSGNTRAAHARDWKAFAAWCCTCNVSPFAVEDSGLAIYLAWMADQGYAPVSVTHAYASIAGRMRESGRWPEGPRPPACRKVIRGIVRTSTHVRSQKQAIVSAVLARLVEHCGDGAFAVRNRALLLLGFSAALRRSELVALNVADCTFSPEGLRIVVRRGKTDQTGKGHERAIRRARGELCAVGAVEAWIALGANQSAPHSTCRVEPSGSNQGVHSTSESRTVEPSGSNQTNSPLFVAMGPGGRLTERRLCDRQVANVVKAACRGAGLPSADFSGHSLRAGFVTECARRGKTLDSIMRVTGHRSTGQVLEYIRHANIFEDNATEGILD